MVFVDYLLKHNELFEKKTIQSVYFGFAFFPMIYFKLPQNYFK